MVEQMDEKISEVLAIANLRYAASRIWACAKHEFSLCWMKFSRKDNLYTTAPTHYLFLWIISTFLKDPSFMAPINRYT